MRFHTLVISGFGPFAGEEAIDFDRLGDEIDRVCSLSRRARPTP